MVDENGQPTHLDLFSGIGGFALAAKWAGFRTIGFCEIDKYCQKILAKNFLADTESTRASTDDEGFRSRVAGVSNGTRTDCPRIFGDIFDLDGRDFAGVTLITGGFPCQPFSCAGKRRGKEDDRHLWPEMLRVIKEARPAWVLGENVAGIINMELDSVLSDLETIGYATRPFVIPACGVDARHRRNRVWIVAKSDAERCGWRSNDEGQVTTKRGRSADSGNVENSHGGRRKQRQSEAESIRGVGRSGQQIFTHSSESRSAQRLAGSERSNKRETREPNYGSPERNGSENGRIVATWLPEPNVGRVAHGIPARVDRLRGLGNAIVPQVAFEILKVIRQIIA